MARHHDRHYPLEFIELKLSSLQNPGGVAFYNMLDLLVMLVDPQMHQTGDSSRPRRYVDTSNNKPGQGAALDHGVMLHLGARSVMFVCTDHHQGPGPTSSKRIATTIAINSHI